MFNIHFFQNNIQIQTKAFFPYDVVWTLGIWRFPLEATNVWLLWEIDENVNQLVRIEGNLLLAYLFIKIQFSILIDCWFGEIRNPDPGRKTHNFYTFINSKLLSSKNKDISNTALVLLLWVKVLFLQENTDFLQKSYGDAGIQRYTFWN